MNNYKEKYMKLKIMREVQNSKEGWNLKKKKKKKTNRILC